MDCRSFRENHLAFLDAALPESELVAMERHLAECDACAKRDTSVRRGLLLVHNLPTIQPSADFAERLNARLRDVCAREAMRRAAERLHRAPGLGTFALAATGLLVASVMVVTVFEWNRPVRNITLPPVVATRPELQAPTLAPPTIVATVPTSISVWPTAYMVEQAPEHFAATQFRLAAWR